MPKHLYKKIPLVTCIYILLSQYVLLSMNTVVIHRMYKVVEQGCKICYSSHFDSSDAPLLQSFGWLSGDSIVHRETSSMVHKVLKWTCTRQSLSDFLRLSDVHSAKLRSCNTINETSLSSKVICFLRSRLMEQIELLKKI